MWNSLYKRRPLNIYLVYKHDFTLDSTRSTTSGVSMLDTLPTSSKKQQEITFLENKSAKMEAKGKFVKACRLMYQAFKVRKRIAKGT
jgi:hypothetical protein